MQQADYHHRRPTPWMQESVSMHKNPTPLRHSRMKAKSLIKTIYQALQNIEIFVVSRHILYSYIMIFMCTKFHCSSSISSRIRQLFRKCECEFILARMKYANCYAFGGNYSACAIILRWAISCMQYLALGNYGAPRKWYTSESYWASNMTWLYHCACVITFSWID